MKGKFGDFWKRHKGVALICIVGIIFLGVFIYEQVTAPVIHLSGILLNTDHRDTDTGATKLANDFVATYEVTSSDGKVMLDDSLICKPNDSSASSETTDSIREIWTRTSQETLDFVAGPMDVMTDLVYNTTVGDAAVFGDLRNILTSEELALYEPYFLYMDQAVWEQLEQGYNEKKDTSSIQLPDCTNPEEMENPIPILINITECEKLSGIYNFPSEGLALGIVVDTPGRDAVLDFLEYIMPQEEQ